MTIDEYVRKAYDRLVEEALRRTPLLELFEPTEVDLAAREQRIDKENRRRESLMRDHLNEPGTTSVCRCGHVAYSTPGYLLHLYEVVEADVGYD